MKYLNRFKSPNTWSWVAVTLMPQIVVVAVLKQQGIAMRQPLGNGDLLTSYVTADRIFKCLPDSSNHVGFPNGIQLAYFPSSDWVHNIAQNLLVCSTGSAILGVNLYWLLSFSIVSAIAFLLAKKSGITSLWAVPAALAISFLPYHWVRITHLNLSNYFSLLLGTYVALVIANREDSLSTRSKLNQKLKWIVILLVISWSGLYYAIFSILFITFSLIWRIGKKSNLKEFSLGLLNPIIIFVGLILSYLPTYFQVRSEPLVEVIASRQVVESVMYGGSVSKLFTPLSNSGFPLGESIRNHIVVLDSLQNSVNFPTTFESGAHGNLIAISAVIALPILGILINRKSLDSRIISNYRFFVSLELLALAFFTVWGANVLFAEFISPQIRAWGRLEPAIYSLAIIASCLGLTAIAPKTKKYPRIIPVMLTLVLLWDICSPFGKYIASNSSTDAKIYRESVNYGKQINTVISKNCGILQLPLVPYPENPPVVNLLDYEHFMMALGNQHKKFSYGVVRGSRADIELQSLVSDLQLLDSAKLKEKGFCLINLDTRGYQPNLLKDIEGVLTNQLGTAVLHSDNSYWITWKL